MKLHQLQAISKNKSIEELFSIGKTVAKMSNSFDFKQTVYSEVAKRFDGDENALIETLINNPSSVENARISSNELQSLKNTINKLKTGFRRRHYPQIYIPYFEELQKRKSSLRTTGDEQIIYVFWDGNETTNDQYPGYVINESGELVKLDQLITAEYAEDHEVWVFSFNERMNLEPVKNLPSLNARISGQKELVSFIKTDNLGAIEGWPAGDLELFLSCASPAFKLFEGYLPSISRSRVKDSRWTDVNHFIFYWYTASHGTMIGLDWTEKDDGGDNDVTVSYTIPANNGLPSTTYTYKISNNDEYLVYQVVQFDDPAYPQTPTTYGNHLLNWQMRNVP